MATIGLEFGDRRIGDRWRSPRFDVRGPMVALVSAALAFTTITAVEPFVADRANEIADASTAAQVATADDVPAGLTADEWASVREQVASATASQITGPVPEFAATGALTRFDVGRVVVTSPYDASSIGLATARIGDEITATVVPVALDDAVAYQHSPSVVEWYRETAGGLQQGFTLSEPVTDDAVTVVEVAVASGTPELVDDQTVSIASDDGAAFWYRDLIAWDAVGTLLPAHIDVVDGVITLNVTTEDAEYPVTIDPTITEDRTVRGVANASGDQSGAAVAIDVDTVVISSPFDDDTGDDAGKVEVWNYDDLTGAVDFEQAWYGASPDEDYGASLDIEGNIFVVGAPGDDGNGLDAGAVYVYTRSGPGQPWAPAGVLLACSAPGCNHAIAGGGTPGDNFGASVALTDAGTKLVVGAPGANAGAGLVYVIDVAPGSYTLDETLSGSHPAVGAFGASVDISSDGSIIGVGAPLTDYSGVADSGVAYAFRDAAGTYIVSIEANPSTYGTQVDGNLGASVAIDGSGVDYLVASEPGAGTYFVHDISDIAANGQNLGNVLQFAGTDVQVSAEGDHIVAGRPSANAGDGAVTILQRTAAFAFSEATPALLLGAESGAAAGFAVSIGSGGSVAIGLPRSDNAADSTTTGPNQVDRGEVRVWSSAGDAFSADPSLIESRILSLMGLTLDEFGYVVDIDGDRMAVSAPFADEPLVDSGVVTIFERTGPGDPWSMTAIVRSPAPEAGGHFGESLDLFGDRLAVGEPDTLGDEAEAGRVWTFELVAGAWQQLGGPIERGAASPGDEFGYSVAFVDADRLVVGAPGQLFDTGGVYVTEYSGGWSVPVALTVGSIDNGDRIGHSVAAGVGASGTLVVAGAPGDDGDVGADAGAVYIWEDVGAGFDAATPVQKIGVDDFGWLAYDGVGSAVNTDGFRIVAGGLGDYSAGQAFTGHAFEVTTPGSPGSPSTWGLVWSFRGVVPVNLGRPVNDYIDIDGGNIALGRPGQGGQVGVFQYDGTTWPALPDTQLIPAGTANGDRVGSSVAIAGRTLVTGASGDDLDGTDSGTVFEAGDFAITHTYGGAGAFDDPASWDTGVVPGPGDTAVVPAGSGSMLLLSGVEVGRLALGAGSTVNIVLGGTLSITGTDSGAVSTIDGTVSNDSTATLNIATDIVIGAGGTIYTDAGKTVNLDATAGDISITGDGTFELDGDLNKIGANRATIGSGITYLANAGAVTNVDEGTLTIDAAVSESGLVSVAAGSTVEYGDEFTGASTTVLEVDIDGQFDLGGIYFGSTSAPDFGGATLRTAGSYTPVAFDSWNVIGCYDCGSPDLVYDVGFLQPTVGGAIGDQAITLTMPDVIVVDTLADTVAADGSCSLREAITAANTDAAANGCAAGSGADTIAFAVAGTITLATRLPIVTTDITIDGEVGGTDVTISGGGTTSILRNDATGSLTLDTVRVINGREQICDGGDTCGAVLNYGTLDVVDSTFTGNNASGFGNGAAITNRGGGVLDVRGSTFSGNSASVAAGAIWNASDGSGTLTVATITNSTFSGNVGPGGAAGAIYNTFNASMTITNSTFSANAGASTIRNAGGAAPIVLRNTIVEPSVIGFACDGPDSFTADSFNFDTDGTCGSATSVPSPALDLGALADNGGPTETIALGSNSVALGAGDTAVCASSPVGGVDQRGQARGQNACSVGAYDPVTAVVNSTGDGSDANVWDDVCETAPGNGECTLRAAIEEANHTFSPVAYIEFDIPGGGVQTITPGSALPNLSQSVVIDGLTQPGADCTSWPPTLNVELDLTNAGAFGFVVNGGDSTITGLVMNRTSQTAIALGSATNTISCNFLGTDSSGTALSGTTEGIWFYLAGADFNTITGNLIASTGLNRGILLTGDDNIVQGNYIQVTTAGVPVLGCCYSPGIAVTGSDNLIGGVGPGEGNVISARSGDAIGVSYELAVGNTIRGNLIRRTTPTSVFGIGIDLSSADPLGGGVTPNDLGDADTGSNNLQNFPVLAGAQAQLGSTRITGSLNSNASRTYDIDVYSTAACHVSGHGDGEAYLGSFQVTTDGSGNVAIDDTVAVAVPAGTILTATATDTVTGDTSEFSACVTVAAPSTAGPTPAVAFANSIGGTGIGHTAHEVTLDGEGNTIVVGYFSGTVDFDPGAGTFELSSIGVGQDAYVAKYDPDGNLLWAQRIGGNEAGDSATGVGTDIDGNVYVAGTFEGNVDFDPSPLVASETSLGARDIFLLKLDADGNFEWVGGIGGIGDAAEARLAVTPGGDAYLGAEYGSSVDLDPGAGVTTVGPATNTDSFVAKYDSSGRLVWGDAVTGVGNVELSDLTVDGNGDVYAGGSFTSTITIGGAGTVSVGGIDGWYAKYDAAGSVDWSSTIAGTGTDAVLSIAANDAGSRVFVAGTGTIAGGFISERDGGGAFVQSWLIGSEVNAVRTDVDDNVYFNGNYSGTVDLDPGAPIFEVTSNSGSNDIFVGKLDAAGEIAWGGSIGGPSLEQLLHRGLAVDRAGNVALAGWYIGVADFDPDPVGTLDLDSGPTFDGFVVKIGTAAVPGLLGYWNFDEASSGSGTGVAADQTGNGNDGTIMGGAQYTFGAVGAGALTFDGTDDFVEVGLVPELDLTGGDYTISFWTKNQGSTRGRIVNMDENADFTGGYSVFTDPQCCRSTHNSGVVSDTTSVYTTLSSDEWHHVALVYDSSAGQRTFWYDGVAQAPFATPGDLTSDGDDPLLFGTYLAAGGGYGQFYEGVLDEVRLYDAALTTGEIRALATLAEPVPDNKIVPAPGGPERFGAAVSVDGDWAAVGQPGPNGTPGSVSVLQRNPVDGTWSIVQTITDPTVENFGVDVSLDGNTLAIAANGGGAGEVQIHLRPDTATPFFPSTYIGSSEDLVIDLSGDDLIIGVDFGGGGSVEIWSRASGSWQPELSTLGAPGFGYAVAIDGDVAAVSDTSNLDAGSVQIFERAGATWTLTDTLTNPDPVTTGDAWFGSALGLDGTTLVVGHNLNDNPDGDEGAVWVYEGVPGAWGSPEKLTGSTIGTGDVFGTSVDVDGDWIVVGAPAHNVSGAITRDGAAFVFARTGGAWSEVGYLLAEDRAGDDSFGAAVAVTDAGGPASILVGAPFDDNNNGIDGGAAYSFEAIEPDNPSLTFSLGLADPTPSVVARGTGIDLADIRQATPLIEERADNSTSIGSTALEDTGVSASPLGATPLGATPFGAIAVSTEELANLPILTIGLELDNGDGWTQILDGTGRFEDIPLVNIKVGDVFGAGRDPLAPPDEQALAGRVDAIPFGAIDVGGTPFGAIPFGAIALGGVPLTEIPPGPDATTPELIEAGWCDVLANTSEACDASGTLDPTATLLSISLSDVPFGAIPFGAIPFGAIPVEDAPFGAIQLSEVRVGDTPFGAIPFGAIPFGAIELQDSPLADIPFGAIPFGAIPFGAIPFGAIGVNGTPFGAIELQDSPFGAIPFGAIDVNGTPFGAIPFGAIALADVSLADIPLDPDRTDAAEIEADWCALMAEFDIDCANPATTVTTTTITDLGVRGVPFGAIPFGAIPFGAIPYGAIPFGAIPFGAIPFGAINLNAVDIDEVDLAGTPFGAIPFGAIPFGAISTSVGAIPFGAIDVQGSPFGAIRLEDIDTDATPFGAIPFGAIPFGAISPDSIPFGAIPFGAIPFGAIPFGAIDNNVGAIPFGAIDLVDSPFGAIPFGAIPFGAIDAIVDCSAIACEGNGTLRDAFLAGAMRPGATIADLGSAADNLRLPDLAEHLIGLQDPDEFYAAIFEWGAGLTLADLTEFANMTLGDLPVDNSLFRQTVLSDVKAGLSTVTFEDLALALLNPGVSDPAGQLELVVDEFGRTLTLQDFETFGDTTFSELLPALGGSTLGEFGSFLAFIHLGDLVDAGLFTTAEVAAVLANAGGSGPNGEWLVIDAVTDTNLNLGDMKLADLIGVPEWGAATVRDLVEALPDDEVAGFTFSDLLLGLLPPGALPWGLAFEEIDAAAIPGVMSPVELTAEFALTGGRRRSVELSVELPTNAAYLPGTASVTPATLGGSLEPVEVDGTLVWTFTGVEPGPDDATPGPTYTVSFEVQPTLSVGSTAVNADTRVVGSNASSSSTTFLQVLEAFEPNNVPNDAVMVAQDVVYLTHIPSNTDIDLFAVDLLENDALAIDLSGVPADFDVVLYRQNPPGVGATALTRVGPGEALVPVLDPDADGTETVPDQGFPRLDLIYPELSLIEISNSRGRATETIVTDRLPGGRYLIQVHGHDGANSIEPAVLQINIIEAGEVPECAVRGPFTSQPAPGATVDLSSLPADLDTVFLVNQQRFEQMYPGEGATVMAALDDLVDAMQTDPEISTLGLSGVVIPVDGFSSVRDAYAFWDDPAANGGSAEDACNPATANDIVSTIVSDILDPIRDAHDIENIVLVGNDDLLPFARLADETQVANEFEYRFDLTGRNSFTSAFWSSTFLSDEPYGEEGARAFGDRFLYVSDSALGRLLESPAQIADQIQLFIDNDGYLDADTGLVAGYDFLIDGSEAIADELREPNGSVPAADLDDSLADGLFDGPDGPEAWDRQNITDALLGTPENPLTGNGFDLISLNAHFDHYRALPAAGDKQPNFNDNLETSAISDPNQLAAAAELFDGTVIFSMGCHSGLNVPNFTSGVQGVTEDWAEVFTDQLAIYVANTGFGYGDTDVVGYTERLMQLFARNVVSPIATDLSDPSTITSIGEALTYAKQQAFSELTDISVYHEKAYQESTFYGLPFFRVGVPPVLAPPPPANEPVVDALTGDPAVTYAGDPTNDANTITRTDGDTETYFSNVDADGDESIITQPGRPIQPSITIDVSDVDPADPTQLEREARGAIIEDMTSSYVQIDPVVATPVFDEGNPGAEPKVDGIVFPTVPQRVATLETPGGVRQQLVLATGQYRGTEQAGQQRLDDDIDVVVYYAEPGNPDVSAPRILMVDPDLDGTELSVTVELDDASGVDRVYALVTPNPNEAQAEWFGIELVDTGGGRWTGGITFASAPAAIELLVQAKDEAGNVGVSTNKAINFGDEAVVALPIVNLTTSVTPSPTGPQVNGIYTGPVTVEADAGGLPITYRLNNTGAFQDLDLENGLVVTGDRAHRLELVAIDGQRTTVEFVIDGSPPAVSISSPVAGAVFAPGAVAVGRFTCRDSSAVTCAASVAHPGGSSAAIVSGGALPTTEVGVYVLTVTATDAVGNTATGSVSYEVVPNLELTVTPAAGTPSPVGDTYRGPVVVDATAGGQPVTYSINGAAPAPVPAGGVTVSDDGDYTVNVESGIQQRSVSFTVDASGPVVTITSPAGEVIGAGDPLTAVFGCVDVLSVPSTCTGVVTGPGIAPVAVGDGGALPTSDEGEFTLTVTGVDAVGNETSETASYTVDATGPAVTITSPDGDVVGAGDVLSASFDCEDLVAGVASCIGVVTGPGLASPVAVADGDALPTSDEGEFTLTVTAVDAVGNGSVESALYTVDATPPVVTIVSPTGDVVGAGDVLSASFECEDLVAGVASCTAVVSGPEIVTPLAVADGGSLPTSDEGEFTLTVTGEDAVGNITSQTATYRVDATPPVVTITSPAGERVAQGSPLIPATFTCVDEFAEPSTCTAELTGPAPVASVADGDGLPTDVPGTYELSVTGTDAVGNSTTETASYVVSAPPEVLAITLPPVPELISDGVEIGVDFDDADGAAEDYTVTIGFGDDSDPDDGIDDATTCTVSTASPVVTGTAAGQPTCSLTGPTAAGPGHVSADLVYPRSGVYQVTVTVTDSAGNTTTVISDGYVVVFNPDDGRVDGKGKYWSDDSSFGGEALFFEDDDLGEWAHFGFKAHYHDKKSDDEPYVHGKTELKLKRDGKDFKFKAEDFDYMIINGTMAIAEGVGEIDKDEGYRFRIQAIDNGDTDFVQLTIWEDGNPGNVIYDNGVIFDEFGDLIGDEVLKGGIKIKS